MRKLALTLTAATFVLGLTAWSASAQTQQLGAASMQAQLNNATPIVTPAACRSFDRLLRGGPAGAGAFLSLIAVASPAGKQLTKHKAAEP